MNERFIKLALNAGILNYVDNETPKRYFIDGHADIEELNKFAELIVRECIAKCDDLNSQRYIADHFGVDIQGLSPVKYGTIECDFTDEELLKYMTAAHELDITFNQFVERALKELILNAPCDLDKELKNE